MVNIDGFDFGALSPRLRRLRSFASAQVSVQQPETLKF
jgi:hypothetical protein